MFDQFAVRRSVSGEVFYRAKALFSSENVKHVYALGEENDTFIMGRVHSQTNSRVKYDSYVRVNLDTGDVLESSCDCPAAQKMRVCKHCAALMLYYIEHKDQLEQTSSQGQVRPFYDGVSSIEASHTSADIYDSEIIDMESDDSGFMDPSASHSVVTSSGRTFGAKIVRQDSRRTPESVKNLLGSYVQADLRISQMPEGGKIDLVPYARIENGAVCLEFRLGNDHKYILKDMRAFCEAVTHGSIISYGKYLEFLHSPEAFTDASQGILQFLLRTYRVRKQMSSSFIHTYSRSSLYPSGSVSSKAPSIANMIRQIRLAPQELDDFVQTMEGDSFFYQSALYTDETLGTSKISVSYDIPRLSVSIRKENGGISFAMDSNGMTLVMGSRYLYFFDENFVHKAAVESLSDILPFLDYIGKEKNTFFANSDLPSFTEHLYPRLARYCEIQKVGYDPQDYLPPAVSFRICLDMPQRDMITCDLQADYEMNGEKKSYAVFRGVMHTRTRNVTEEVRVSNMVSAFFSAFDRSAGLAVYQAVTEDDIPLFMADVVPQLESIAPVYLSDALKRIHVIDSPRIQVGVSLHEDLLRLDLVSDELTLDELSEILSRYDRNKRFYRLKKGDFVTFSDQDMNELYALEEGLGISGSDLKKGEILIPGYRALYLDALSQDRNLLAFEKDAGFRRLVMQMQDIDTDDSVIPEALSSIMRDYQKEGFHWLKKLSRCGFGGILADEMGLGKTLQVLTFLLSEKEDAIREGKSLADLPRALIVCPASLVYNWRSEIEKFTPQLGCELSIGIRANRKRIAEEVRDEMENSSENHGSAGTSGASGISDSSGVSVISDSSKFSKILNQPRIDVIITSYDLLRRDVDLYEDMTFSSIIIDEAQYIKNPSTQMSKAVKTIHSRFHLALTGTPIENRLSELWSIFDYLMPGFLYSYQHFRDVYETPASSAPQEDDAKDLQRKTAIASLRRMTTPFILRRLKKNVLKDLPDKMEEKIYAQMSKDQHELYQAHMQRLKLLLESQSDEEFRHGKIMVLSELTRLRQICCDPSLVYKDYKGNSAKADLCIEMIESAIESGHKVLLFSQFTSMFELLKPRLAAAGISYHLLTGSTPKKERMEMADSFQTDDVPLFCISLKAGGTGLNLTAADIVIHYDPWWNLAVENQATDRAHRIGQENVVTVYKLLMKDTIEERIQSLQDAKSRLAGEILSGEEVSSASLTRDDLIQLLR